MSKAKSLLLFTTITFLGFLVIPASVQAIPNTPVCVDEDCSIAKLNTLRALASRGHKQTSFTLGHMFMNPESGLKTDLENAYYYFRKSAKQGFYPGYRQAAGMAASGIGTEKDINEAKALMKEAAEKGVDRTAEEYAALVVSDENASKEEREVAIAYLEAEVEEGMSYLANYLLALLYINGEHVTKDYDRAIALLQFPASGEYSNSVELLTQLNGNLEQDVIENNADKPAIVTSKLDPNIETISIRGISENMVDLHALMLSELRKSHGQTGSRILGNGCKKGDPACEIIEDGSIRSHTFWNIGAR